MIRREIHLPDRPPQWLLISQVEHARLSGVLAEHCLPDFEGLVRNELIQAIIHHDDGWADWELAAQIDPNYGRPYSFRELCLDDSLAIWKKSIDAAAEFGTLAGWVVAKHFLSLLSKLDAAKNTIATQWRDEVAACCDQWLAIWAKGHPELNAKAISQEGLAWLQLMDMVSLWLCAVCPGRNEPVTENCESYLFAEGQTLQTWCHFRRGVAGFEPWLFSQPMIEVSASGLLVPVRCYEDPLELSAASIVYEVEWQINQL